MQIVREVSTAPNNCRPAVRPGMLSGRERTLDEYPRLITDGGFGEVTVTPTNTPMTMLGAIAA